MTPLKNTIIGVLATSTLAVGGGVAVDKQINPYTDRVDRVEMLTVSDLPNSGEQKIEVMKNKPQMRYKKFGGEVDLGITYDGVKATGNRPLFSNKMEFKDAKQEMAIYPINATSTEFEVILNEKPATNIVTFTLDNWQNLDFFYQPALTPQEIAEGAERPENVIGSYAVYANGKANYCTNCGTPNYGMGKVGHIFRPLINDSAGTEVWGDLHIENGILSVTIPQDFLDNAVYPVRHAAGLTFGYTSIGGTSVSHGNSIAIGGGDSFSPASNGTVDSISIYASAVSKNFKGGIYTTGGSLSAYHNTNSAAVSTAAWYTITMNNGSVSSTTSYYILTKADAISTWYYDSGSNALRYFSTTYTTNWPASVTFTTNATRNYSIYATYTADAPPASATTTEDIIWFY